MRDGSIKLYKFLNEKVYGPLKQQLYVLYDQSSNYFSFFVQVLKD